MKTYFTSPIKNIEGFENNIKTIYDCLIKLGHSHIDNVMNRLEDKDFYEKLEKGGKQTHENFYNQTINNIKKADINIFECSVPSLGVGFQIEKSIENNKPTIIMYFKEQVPHFLSGIESDKLITCEYDKNNINQVLEQAIENARHVVDKRFNFFITPSLLNYLEEESNRLGLTKSAFIRNLILDHKKKRKT